MDTLIASPFLSLRLDPPTARPSQDALIQALQECTRFRLHAAEDSTPQAPHFSSVEFENIGLAHKAFATIRNQQLSTSTSNGTTCTLSLHPHDASPGSAPPSPPKDARPLNISELPPQYAPAQVYDRFIGYGPIFSCEMPLLRGSCRLTFCDPKHASRAQEEMNFSALETYQIIVRFPSKYDAKDSFKAAQLGLGVQSAHAQQQQHQHQQRRVVSESVPASGATRPGPGADAGDRRASAGGHHATVNRTAIFASSINGIIQQARGPASQQPSPPYRTNATPDGTAHTEADASADASAATTMPSTPAPSKKAAGPVKISEPVRLIVQNLPSSLDAPGLYRLFAGYGSLAEASLASHRATGARLGIGLLRYSTPGEAAGALRAMNGRFVEGHRASQPLYIKLWELKGELERDLRTDEGKVLRAEPEAEAGPGGAAPSQPQPAASAAAASPPSDAGELVDKASADRRETSFASTSSASAATADTTLVSNVSSAPSSPAAGQLLPGSGKADSAEAEHAGTDADFSASAIAPELRRHHKLLLLSLQDDLREPPERAEKLAGLLVRLLPESERNKCILNEEYLRERVRKAGEAFGGPELGSEGHVGIEPERVVYDRAALLQLYSPTACKNLALDEMAVGVSATPSAASSRSRSVSPTARKSLMPAISPGHERAIVETEGEASWAAPQVQPTSPRPSMGNPTASVSLSLETLVRFSARGIIDLAASAAPPVLLSSRPADKVASVDAFLETIKGLKPSQQKQRVGERIFKLFKGAPGPPMRNISKRTVALLDQEDLAALAHLAEEFPDVLVAKARAMQV